MRSAVSVRSRKGCINHQSALREQNQFKAGRCDLCAISVILLKYFQGHSVSQTEASEAFLCVCRRGAKSHGEEGRGGKGRRGAGRDRERRRGEKRDREERGEERDRVRGKRGREGGRDWELVLDDFLNN